MKLPWRILSCKQTTVLIEREALWNILTPSYSDRFNRGPSSKISVLGPQISVQKIGILDLK